MKGSKEIHTTNVIVQYGMENIVRHHIVWYSTVQYSTVTYINTTKKYVQYLLAICNGVTE